MSLESGVNKHYPPNHPDSSVPSLIKNIVKCVAAGLVAGYIESNVMEYSRTFAELNRGKDKTTMEQEIHTYCLTQVGGSFYCTLTQLGREIAYKTH